MLSLVGQFSLMRLKNLSVLVHGDIHVHLSTVFKKTTVRSPYYKVLYCVPSWQKQKMKHKSRMQNY